MYGDKTEANQLKSLNLDLLKEDEFVDVTLKINLRTGDLEVIEIKDKNGIAKRKEEAVEKDIEVIQVIEGGRRVRDILEFIADRDGRLQAIVVLDSIAVTKYEGTGCVEVTPSNGNSYWKPCN